MMLLYSSSRVDNVVRVVSGLKSIGKLIPAYAWVFEVMPSNKFVGRSWADMQNCSFEIEGFARHDMVEVYKYMVSVAADNLS